MHFNLSHIYSGYKGIIYKKFGWINPEKLAIMEARKYICDRCPTQSKKFGIDYCDAKKGGCSCIGEPLRACLDCDCSKLKWGKMKYTLYCSKSCAPCIVFGNEIIENYSSLIKITGKLKVEIVDHWHEIGQKFSDNRSNILLVDEKGEIVSKTKDEIRELLKNLKESITE